MSYVGKVSAASEDHFVASTAYGTCATAAGTAAQIVVMDDFDTLLTGVTIHVLFQNSNTAESPTLNVNNTGAKPIYISGVESPGSTAAESWDANSIVSFTYDGSAWRMNDVSAHFGDVAVIVGDGQLVNFTATDLTGAANELKAEVTAVKSTGISITALSANWSSSSPYTQSITAAGVSANSNIIVSLASNITSAAYDIACDAKLVCTGQGANSITMTCYGLKPAIDIPLSVVILG